MQAAIFVARAASGNSRQRGEARMVLDVAHRDSVERQFPCHGGAGAIVVFVIIITPRHDRDGSHSPE